MSRKIDVVCFSGTGNTSLIVNYIVNILNEKGIEVRQKLWTEPYIPKEGNELILAFPANSQAVSPYVWKYIKRLPGGNGNKVYALITLNESAAILSPLRKLLLKKKYVPQGAVEISMPNNLVTGDDNTHKRLKDAFIKAGHFALDLINGNLSWKECNKGSAFVSFLSRNTVLPWVAMRMLFKLEVDERKCTKCGLCIKECPVKNIKMADFPVHMGKCEFCMRCGAFCKNGAVYIKGKPNLKIRCANHQEEPVC
jgi:ferredoxin